MAEIADERNIPFINVFEASEIWYQQSTTPLTQDGFQLTDEGYKKFANYLATVIFGRAGTQLLPMLREGPEGLVAVMEEAKKLGIVMSTEDATAAAKLTDGLTRLGAVVKMMVVRIGGGLAPALTSLSDRIAGGVRPILD